MLQSWFYGESKSSIDGFKVRTFSISDPSSDSDIAIAQVLYKKVPILGPVVRINRGPIFLSGDISESQKLEALETLLSTIKLESFLFQIAPEMPNSDALNSRLISLGFKKLSNVPWSSGKIDLLQDEDEILMSLNGKWRNCFRKGKKMGVEVNEVSNSDQELEKLLDFYVQLQRNNEFTGLTTDLILSLSHHRHDFWRFNLYKASELNEEETLGYLVSVDHGDSSIYLIGVTNNLGRKYQANYVLLWNSIINAKNRGIKSFDIGGLSQDTPKGIAHFKKGLNSELYELTGEWRSLSWKNLIKI